MGGFGDRNLVLGTPNRTPGCQKVLQAGMEFPYDLGFVLSTRGGGLLHVRGSAPQSYSRQTGVLEVMPVSRPVLPAHSALSEANILLIHVS